MLVRSLKQICSCSQVGASVLLSILAYICTETLGTLLRPGTFYLHEMTCNSFFHLLPLPRPLTHVRTRSSLWPPRALRILQQCYEKHIYLRIDMRYKIVGVTNIRDIPNSKTDYLICIQAHKDIH